MTDENSNAIPYPYEEFSSFWEDIFHDVNYDGIIFICGKTKKEKFYTIRRLSRHELCDHLKTFEIFPNMNYYFTSNHFLKRKGGVSRRSNNFFAATCTIIDIDIHDIRKSQDFIDKELARYKAKLDTLISLGEAFPYHYCVFSGRGLQFVYIYERAINFKLELMHNRIQELILRQHAKLLADNPDIEIKLDKGTTKKTSGVYRMPGTFNIAVDRQVTYQKTDYHFLDTSKIIDDYGFFDTPPGSRRISTYHINPEFKGSKKRKSRNNISHCRKMINAVYEYQSDHYAYRQHPGHENRNCTCFVLIHLLLEVMPYDDVLEKILLFNRNFYVPLPEKRLKSMLDYAYENYLDENKYKMRFLKTSTILEMLNLSDSEYGIHDNSEARKKLEEERALRREQKKNRDVIICELFNKGLEYQAIASQAKCSIRTVNRVINKHYPRKDDKCRKYEEIRALYLTGMPYSEISNKTGIPLRTITHTLSAIYPNERPKPWKDVGMTKEEFYEQHKRNNP